MDGNTDGNMEENDGNRCEEDTDGDMDGNTWQYG